MERWFERLALENLRRDGEALACRFSLCYRAIEAEPPQVKRRYGVCFSDGTIRIRLRHATTGRLLKYSSLINTLCHELAHLRHFNHGRRFRVFYWNILEYARCAGIYAPGSAPAYAEQPRSMLEQSAPRRTPMSPQQLPLFTETARG